MVGKPVPLRLVAARAEKLIRELAADSSNVVITSHARDRMEERDFTDHDLMRVLGFVTSDPERTSEGDWKCKMVRRLAGAGQREGGAVVVIRRHRLIVVTMEWEDLM